MYTCVLSRVTWQRSRAEASCLSAPRPEDPTAATGLPRRGPTQHPALCKSASSSNHPSIRLQCSRCRSPQSPHETREAPGPTVRLRLAMPMRPCPARAVVTALFRIRALRSGSIGHGSQDAAAAPGIEGAGFRLYRELVRLPGSDLLLLRRKKRSRNIYWIEFFLQR
jgi:hypothetical protein